MSAIFKSYFYEKGFFEMAAHAAANGNVQDFKSMVDLVIEFVWLTNNIIVEEIEAHQNGYKVDDEDTDPFQILYGIDQTYVQIISGFEELDKDLQMKLKSVDSNLSDQFWDVMAWGMSLLIQILKSKDQVEVVINNQLVLLNEQKIS